MRQWANASGQVTYAARYAPFGAVLWQQGSAPSPWGFAGEMQDPTGLIYLRARWYDPGTGRFLTRDPVPGLPSLPASLNPYVYAGNNPVRYVDPTGKFFFIPLLLVGMAGGILGGLGYYGIQSYMHPNPCTGRMNWDWNQALFWGGVGGVIGAGVASIGYGGWWVGLQAGWWGPAAAGGAPTILWLEQQAGRVQHIMTLKHAWDRLVTLTGNVAQDYQAVQPYMQQAINSGTSTQIGVTSEGPLMQFVTTINGQQVVVIAIQISENVYKISNAWVQTR